MQNYVICTVTCRQFSNLTFAPRKTCSPDIFGRSNLTLHRYQCHSVIYYTTDILHLQALFSIFLSVIFIRISIPEHLHNGATEIREYDFLSAIKGICDAPAQIPVYLYT